jgi:hypothetical protein
MRTEMTPAAGTVEGDGGARRAAGRYLRFLAVAGALTLGLALLGVLPTRWAAGDEGIPALFAGCLVSWFASALGGLPILLAELAEDPARRAKALVGSMVLRFAVELLLLVAIAWSGRLDRGPFLIWAALSYLALLAVDTNYAQGPRREPGRAS